MSKSVAATIDAGTLTKRDTVISIFIIGVLFFVFGFVSWVNSILIPYFKIACELTNFESYLVAFAFYISYFIMSVPSGNVFFVNYCKFGMAYYVSCRWHWFYDQSLHRIKIRCYKINQAYGSMY